VRETIDNWRVQGDIIDRYSVFLRYDLFIPAAALFRYVLTLGELIEE